jgi:hypothetical protein
MILTDAARVVDLLNMSEMLRENARTPQRELEVIQQRS